MLRTCSDLLHFQTHLVFWMVVYHMVLYCIIIWETSDCTDHISSFFNALRWSAFSKQFFSHCQSQFLHFRTSWIPLTDPGTPPMVSTSLIIWLNTSWSLLIEALTSLEHFRTVFHQFNFNWYIYFCWSLLIFPACLVFCCDGCRWGKRWNYNMEVNL